MKRILLAAVSAVALGIGAVAVWMALQPAPSQGPQSEYVVNAGGASIGGEFTLTDHTGETVSAGDVIDGPTLVYFGYTYCPDVCPFDTQRMVEAVTLLEERGIEVDPVFVTVDPARDDVAAVKVFAEAFHPRMTGLTGTPEQIEAAADAYKVYYEKVDAESEAGYLMNHTSFTYFMLPGSELGAMFRNETPPQVMADEVARVLEARGLTG